MSTTGIINTCILSYAGLMVPANLLRTKCGNNYDVLLTKLTLRCKQKIGPDKVARMYERVDHGGVIYMHLPRTLLTFLLQAGIVDTVGISWDPLVKIPAKMSINLFDNQQTIVDYLCKEVFSEQRIAAGTACALLNLRAGMGKTYVAAGVIAKLGVSTLYIVPKCPLALQAVKDLRACFQDSDTKVGQYDKKSKHDISVIVINSALACDTQFFRNYSLIIFDEIHSYCSENRRKIFRKCSNPLVLGMTATSEDRADGFDPIAHREVAFDGIIRAENIPGFAYEDDVAFNCVARVINYSACPKYAQNLVHESTGNVFTHYMHNQFIADEFRTEIAINHLLELYDWRGDNGQMHGIYVFAEEIEILRKAKVAFEKALKARQREDVAMDMTFEAGLEMFTGGLKDQQITEIINTGRILFSSYGFAGTGVSILKMSAILLLTPRKANMKQICARITRRGSDLTIPRIIVDIVDTKTCLKHQYNTRKLAYNYYGYQIEKIKVKHPDAE